MTAAAEKPAADKKPVAKKAPSPPPPPIPASISTAHLILRGVVAGIVGAPIGSASQFQRTYLKETPRNTGKFSVNLGKKNGTNCQLEIPEDADDRELLLKKIEEAANRIISQNVEIRSHEMTRSEAVTLYGDCAFDASQLKVKKGQENAKMVLVYIPGVVLGALAEKSTVLASTGGLERIVLEFGTAGGCSVSGGKKAKKCEVVIKFEAVSKADGRIGTVLEDTEGRAEEGEWAPLKEADIRMEEGTAFSKHLEQKELTLASLEIQPPTEEVKEEAVEEEEMIVNIEEVSGKIDYKKLVDQFGSQLITSPLLTQLHSLTVGKGTVPKLHRFLRRNIFFSHRDLNKILDCAVNGRPIFLYTGRGPSSDSMHLGHLVPFLFTKWLQQAFQCPLVIQLTDDEKFIFKGTYCDETGDNLSHFHNLAVQNAKDIIACGFIKEKTFLFSDLDYIGRMYPNIVRIWKSTTSGKIKNIFGFDGTANMGKIAFPAVQAAPSFSSSFPVVLNGDDNVACLIPCAIDQDPYFRMTREIAHRIVGKSHPLQGKPSLIHSKFFPPLQGAAGKMSSSNENSAVFLTDPPALIAEKIKKHAFSGGHEKAAEQKERGADLEVDVSYQWLRFFLEDDDLLERIGKEYGSGTGEYWSTNTVKNKLIDVLSEVVDEHQKRRALVTDEVVREWMQERSIV